MVAESFIGLALEDMASTLGVAFPDLILIVIVLSCLIVFGIGVRIGLIFATATLSFSYIFFNLVGLSTNNILIVLMITLVMLTLSFFIKPNSQGVV